MDRKKYISELDSQLIPLGFSRRKNAQEWRRTINKEYVEWVHLNFGLAVINVSQVVKYKYLEKISPEQFGPKPGTFINFSSISGNSYSDENDPDIIRNDFMKYGIGLFEKLRDEGYVIELLEKDEAKQWPVVCLSDRIRLLPLLLFYCNRKSEAFMYIEEFLKKYKNEDQYLPSYEIFKNEFAKIR